MNFMSIFKNRLKIKFVAVLISFIFLNDTYAQAPEAFNYQGIALDSKGVPVVSKKISLRISILQRNQTDSVVLQETHSPTTDKYGQFSLNIGLGLAVKGKMSNVQFNKYPHYIKSEMDINGGSSFVDMGTTQLLSVPYALNAATAGSVSNNIAQYIKTDSGRIKAGIFIGDESDLKLANNNNRSNLIVGIGAGYSLVSKTNTAISNFNNSDNVILGNSAGRFLRADENANGGMAATGNVLIGNLAGEQMGRKSVANTFIGGETGRFSSASDWGEKLEGNVAIGGRSLQYANKAIANVLVGDNTFNSSSNVNLNVAIGNNIGSNFRTGDNNIFIGSSLLDSISSGSKNVVIGSNGISKLRGDANVLIGYNVADNSKDSISNKLYIANSNTTSPLIFGEFDNKKLTINGDLIVTGKTSFAGTVSNYDSAINVLSKKVDSLIKVISSGPIRIDTSTKVTAAFSKNFLDSTLLPAINFNGSSSYINVGSTNLSTKLNGNNFTIEFWVKSKSKTTTSQTIFSTGYDFTYGCAINTYINNGKLYFNFLNGNHFILTDYPNDSAWHHVAYVNKDKSTSTIYIDGIEKMRSNNVGLGLGTSQKVSIGSYIVGSGIPQDYFNGNIRKVRINRGVSYTANFTPSYAYGKIDSTVVFWEMNDLGTQIKASDSTYNGILYNGVWIAGKSKLADHFSNSLVLGPTKEACVVKEDPTIASFSRGSSTRQKSQIINQPTALGNPAKYSSAVSSHSITGYPSYDLAIIKGRYVAQVNLK